MVTPELMELTMKQVSGIVRLTRGEETQMLLESVLQDFWVNGYENGYDAGWDRKR